MARRKYQSAIQNYYALFFNENPTFERKIKMKNFLEKYNAFKIETSKDEGKLTLETAKERILKLLTDNIRNFKEESWNLQNRMNKLIIDTEKNSIFTLRLGGKRIVRYSLNLLDTQQKISFLFDFYNSVEASEFNEDITDFLAKEIRKNKKKAEREQKAKERQEEYARKVEEARQKTLAAAEPMLHEMYIQSEAARQNEQNQYVSERV